MDEAGIQTVVWKGDRLRLIDQTRLPWEERYVELRSVAEIACAIKRLVVRGAPAIGVAAAFGVVLAAKECVGLSAKELAQKLTEAISLLESTRPTAVNLFWATQRMRSIISSIVQGSGERCSDKVGACVSVKADEIVARLEEEALRIYNEDRKVSRAIAANGSKLINDGDNLLTHCNTGALATSGEYGTALGAIRRAFLDGKRIHVYVDETRPVLQGARLTAWELMREGIPMTLITDTMAGYFMHKGMIDAVFVGADRIAINGDVVNKIGTFTLSVLAKSEGVPFYVVAPLSSVDEKTVSGEHVPIEERDAREVCEIGGVRVASDGVHVANPAFDVTPSSNVTAIVTEAGVIYPPFERELRRLKEGR